MNSMRPASASETFLTRSGEALPNLIACEQPGQRGLAALTEAKDGRDGRSVKCCRQFLHACQTDDHDAILP